MKRRLLLLQHLRRQLSYDDWANLQVLAALRSAGALPESRSVKILAHVLAAEWLWLGRLKREAQTVAVWPGWTLEECERQIGRLPRAWEGYCLDLSLPKLTDRLAYTNSKGEAWTNTVGDILTHVTLHSAYHRGQIALDMRASGQTPAETDFIHSIRRGFTS